jgi:hypothetical protein
MAVFWCNSRYSGNYSYVFCPKYYSALRQAVTGHEMNRSVVRSSYTNYATGLDDSGFEPGISKLLPLLWCIE